MTEQLTTHISIDPALVSNRRSQRDVRSDFVDLAKRLWRDCDHYQPKAVPAIRKAIADDGELLIFAVDLGIEAVLAQLRHQTRKAKAPSADQVKAADERMAAGYAAMSSSLLETYRLFDGTALGAATRDHVEKHLAFCKANIVGNFKAAYVMHHLLADKRLAGGVLVGKVFKEAALKALFDAAEEKRLVVDGEPDLSFAVRA